jgi:hypothetical protein
MASNFVNFFTNFFPGAKIGAHSEAFTLEIALPKNAVYGTVSTSVALRIGSLSSSKTSRYILPFTKSLWSSMRP